MNKKFISLIIPNMKISLLDSFLQNCFQFIPKDNTEIIIVSSALDKTNLKKYSKKYPSVNFVLIKENKGFAATVNRGFQIAKGEIVGTVNDDVILEKNWLSKLTSNLNPKFGSINPIITDTNKNIESAGIKVYKKGKAEPIKVYPKKNETIVDATNAACVLYNRKALNEVGFFDEKFGSYLEDIDLSLRLSKAGWLNLVNSSVSVRHLKHATSKSFGKYKNYLDFRNWIFVIIKNWSIKEIIVNFPEIIIERAKNFSALFK